jgi:hypothetical protein
MGNVELRCRLASLLIVHAAASSTAAPAPASRRLWEIDALRGLMLVLMTVTHIPTRFTDPLGQPFGYVSAAEGFVLLSGFMAGLIYTQRQRREGDEAMQEAFYKRALKLYAVQASLLLFLLSVVALLGLARQEEAVTNLLSWFLERPIAALVSGLLLIYNPPLLDILPMYVLFMLASPVLLLHGARHGWALILGASLALWLGVQFGLSHWLHAQLVALVGMPVPFRETGAFEMLAWQLLWVLGLWMGAGQGAQRPVQPEPFGRSVVALALLFAAVHLVWRHALGQAPFGADTGLNLLYDKWRLGPLRLLDLMALIVLAMHFGPRLAARLPRLSVLELLGRQSLPVFVAHVVLAMLVLASLGSIDPQRPWHIDIALLAACFGVLYIVAHVSESIDRRAAEARERWRRKLRERREAGRRRRASGRPPGPPARDAAKPPRSTAHSPPG